MEEVVIKHILEERKISIEKIKKFLKRVVKEERVKRGIILSRIILAREAAASLINKKVQAYLTKRKYISLSLSLRNYYSLSPSFDSSVTKMGVTIYTSSSNINNFKTYNMQFCPLRKRFVLDIRKTIFKDHKTLLFNFVVNDHIVIDSHFETVNINNNFINKLNFEEVENKIQLANLKLQRVYDSDLVMKETLPFCKGENRCSFSTEGSETSLKEKRDFKCLKSKSELLIGCGSIDSQKFSQDELTKERMNWLKEKMKSFSCEEVKSILRKKCTYIRKTKTNNIKRRVSFGSVFYC